MANPNKQITAQLRADDKARRDANAQIRLRGEFNQIRGGLNANAERYREGSAEERARAKAVLARLPENRHKMATVLLKSDMSPDDIVKACLVGACSRARRNKPSDLYAASANAAVQILGIDAKIAGHPLLSEADRAPLFKIDENIYAQGEESAKQLLHIVGRKAGEI